MLYLLRILFNCAFNAFYRVNHGLEVPRETRLEKLMRLLEVLEKIAWRKSRVVNENHSGGAFLAQVAHGQESS